MPDIRIANAPCSWGTLEFEGLEGERTFCPVTERLRARGYRGWIVVEQDALPRMGSPKASAQRNWEYLRSIGL